MVFLAATTTKMCRIPTLPTNLLEKSFICIYDHRVEYIVGKGTCPHSQTIKVTITYVWTLHSYDLTNIVIASVTI